MKRITKEEMIQKKEEYLLAEKMDEKSENTLKHYRHVIEMFIEASGNEVTKMDIMRFKEHLIQRYKSKTVSNYITIINKFIKYIEMIDEDESKELSDLKEYKRSQMKIKNIKMQQVASLDEVLEPSDLKKMLRMAKKRDYEMYLVMRIFAYTGIRAEELKYFTVENIKSNYIQVRNKGKIRKVIMTNSLKNELQKYCKEMNMTSGYIFKGKKDGKMMHSTTVYKRLKKIAGMCRGIKLDKVHPHSFRHLFAVKFLKDGGAINDLADILGHKNINTTMIYARTTDKMKKEQLERMKY